MHTRLEDLRETIVSLRAKSDGLIAIVKACVDVVDRINALGDRKQRAQNAVNTLRLVQGLEDTASKEERIGWMKQVRPLGEQITANTGMGNVLSIPATAKVGKLRELYSDVMDQVR